LLLAHNELPPIGRSGACLVVGLTPSERLEQPAERRTVAIITIYIREGTYKSDEGVRIEAPMPLERVVPADQRSDRATLARIVAHTVGTVAFKGGLSGYREELKSQ
jgi:hypothetical protein